MAAQLVARLEDEFGVEIDLLVVFDHPTAAGIAARHRAATPMTPIGHPVERALMADGGARSRRRDPSVTPARALTGCSIRPIAADPYPLYPPARSEDPVHWDPFLHAWVVTRYDDVHDGACIDTRRTGPRRPSSWRRSGWTRSAPIAEVMVRQMLYLDPPEHTQDPHTRGKGLHATAGSSCCASTSRRSSTSCSTRCYAPAQLDVIADLRGAAACDRLVRDARTADRRLAAAERVDAGVRRAARQLSAQPGCAPARRAAPSTT